MISRRWREKFHLARILKTPNLMRLFASLAPRKGKITRPKWIGRRRHANETFCRTMHLAGLPSSMIIIAIITVIVGACARESQLLVKRKRSGEEGEEGGGSRTENRWLARRVLMNIFFIQPRPGLHFKWKHDGERAAGRVSSAFRYVMAREKRRKEKKRGRSGWVYIRGRRVETGWERRGKGDKLSESRNGGQRG